MPDLTPMLPGLSSVAGKTVVAKFDGGRLSSDGGLLLLREAEHDAHSVDMNQFGFPERGHQRRALARFDQFGDVEPLDPQARASLSVVR